ncbi:unnamed protein product, partial [marine sediment metagenome]
YKRDAFCIVNYLNFIVEVKKHSKPKYMPLVFLDMTNGGLNLY